MAHEIPAEMFPPGEIIRDEMEERGWNQADLAEILGRPLTLVNEVLTGRRAITPETAQGLGDAFDVNPQFFLNLESAYQLWKVATTKGRDEDITRRASLYNVAPVRELVRRQWVERSDVFEVLEQRVIEFYGVKSFAEFPRLWPVAARKAAGGLTWSHWAWLVRAKRLGAQARVSGVFSDARLNEAIERLKGLMHAPPEARHVPKVLADAGIRFVVVEHLPKTKWDGACFWLDAKSPVVAMSLRYDRIDYFWHTLLHELRHVEKRHALRDYVPVDEDIFGETASNRPRPEIERQVDVLAAETLIPAGEIDNFVARTTPLYSKKKIVGFANRIRVHPGIVVGQLQHRGEIGWTHSREMLARIREFVIGATITDGWGNFVSVSA
jgi:HTH-type transcriptional regulator / antitoxin HigA